ncbi:hypothetical protein Bbelb_320440 [Branchiostoma belcheri]|nr:hypothetical protein Bbelb_320440 [Branchiostoma belcheri]
MGRRLRAMLVFLTIILKLFYMTEAACSCSSSSSTCYCDNQGYSSVPQHLSTRINSLYLRNNQITALQLTTLYLHNNNITDIPANAFSNQPKLSTLHLYTNRISAVSQTAFRGLTRLSTLYLYNNDLTELPDFVFYGLSSLNNLRLYDNAILQIFPNTFTGISSLSYLYLYGNNIKTFPIEALSEISSISQLYLQNNHMTTLPFTAYNKLTSVSTVDISNNPWQCDCRMVAFRLKMTGSPSFHNQITCTNPRNSGQLLKDINPEDLTCEDPTIVRFEKVYNNSVVEGGTLHLVCESSGIPKPDVTVILPSGLNVTVESGGRVTVTDNGTITITYVTAAIDAGLYICIATSPVGSTFQTLSVDVQPNMPSTVTMTPQNITDKPESNSYHGSGPGFSLPVLVGSVLGAVAGSFLICITIFLVWCKRRAKNPPPGPDTSVVFNNINTTATVSSGHGQTGQGRSQNVTNPSYAQRSAVPQLPLDLYEDVELPPSTHRPKGAGPKQPAKKKALKPPNRNKAPDDERPPPPPPRAGAATGAAAAVYANEPAAALDHLPYYQPLTKK